MDFSDPTQQAVFFDVHCDLPREGPGDRETVLQALTLVGELPRDARVLDIACGPGGQTIDLAQALPAAEVIAVDLHEPFLRRLEASAKQLDLGKRISVLAGDMQALSPELGMFDLLWCEGAAYIVGLEKALRLWRSFLNPNGRIAFSEPVWLRDDAPPEVRSFWANGYPGMMSLDECRGAIARAGYSLLGDFVLPEKAWWTNYYSPMERRISMLEAKYESDDVALSVVRECSEEIEFYRKFSQYYGYGFLVAAPNANK